MQPSDENYSIRFPPSRDSSYRKNSNESDSRPAGNPRSEKDFKKILRKDTGEEAEEELSEEVSADGDANVANTTLFLKKKRARSLFDLSQGKNPKETTDAGAIETGEAIVKNRSAAAHGDSTHKEKLSFKKNTHADDDTNPQEAFVESPSALFSKLSNKESKKVMTPKMLDMPDTANGHDHHKTKYISEQPDISYINPMGAIPQVVGEPTITTNQTKQVLPPANIQEIIDQIVDKVYTMNVEGRTDTTITLKHPPMFEGATLVVSAYDSARGEFNIAFENLTPEAKQLLDMRANQESLRNALEEKGYAVHIVTTTTLEDDHLKADPHTFQHEQREREEEKKDGRQRRNNREQEEEEGA
jgi:hypothetical protein